MYKNKDFKKSRGFAKSRTSHHYSEKLPTDKLTENCVCVVEVLHVCKRKTIQK